MRRWQIILLMFCLILEVADDFLRCGEAFPSGKVHESNLRLRQRSSRLELHEPVLESRFQHGLDSLTLVSVCL